MNYNAIRYEINRILMVDDEEGNLSDYRKFLRDRGIDVTFVTRLDEAVKILKESFRYGQKFDIVIIDLMFKGQEMPVELLPFYDRIINKNHNEGQALGRWLWDQEGAHQLNNRPIHFYFSTVPSLYSPAIAGLEEEFFSRSMNINGVNCFLVDKLSTRPSKLIDRLILIRREWARLMVEFRN